MKFPLTILNCCVAVYTHIFSHLTHLVLKDLTV